MEEGREKRGWERVEKGKWKKIRGKELWRQREE
jgi:hypothetical protein